MENAKEMLKINQSFEVKAFLQPSLDHFCLIVFLI